MDDVIRGLEGITCSADDILVHAPDIKTLNERTHQLFIRLQKRGVKLNPHKCQHRAVKELTFLGHLITDRGVRPDPDKIESLNNFKVPHDATSLKRFLGFAQYLSKFIRNFSELTAPLFNLTKTDNFEWKKEHTTAFEIIKKAIHEDVTLRFFDVNEPVTLQVDASSHTLGACLLQDGAPIAFKSASLTSAQQKWAQLDKEALAIRFGCEKFHEFIYGMKKLIIETDHRPLVQIFNKPISAASPRIQNILYRLQIYGGALIHVKGTDMIFADFLSRDIAAKDSAEENILVATNYVVDYPKSLDIKLLEETTYKDDEAHKLYQQIKDGWPKTCRDVHPFLKPYFQFKDQLSVMGDLVLFSDRIVIPPSLRRLMLEKLHSSHQGIEATLRLARETIFWPGMSKDVTEFVNNCITCSKFQRSPPNEPYQSHPIPDRPWQYLSMDVFHVNSCPYLAVIDSYSGFLSVEKLANIESKTIIKFLKNLFFTNGLPDTIVNDNARPFISAEFKNFAKEFNFSHVNSSPEYPRSNGLAERGVQTAKRLVLKAMEDAKDYKEAIFIFNNTPQEFDLGSPAKRLFGRRCKTWLPSNDKLLKPEIQSNVSQNLKKRREKSAYYGNLHSHPLKDLESGTSVWFKTQGHGPLRAIVLSPLSNGRSYVIKSESGQTFRRNRKQLILAPSEPEPVHETSPLSSTNSSNTSFQTPPDSSVDPIPDEELTEDHPEAVPMPRKSERTRTLPQRYSPSEFD